MTIEDLKYNILHYHLFIDALAEDEEEGFINEDVSWHYTYKDGTEWDSYSTCWDDENDPNYGETWQLCFCNAVSYEDENYVEFAVKYSNTLYKIQFGGDEEKLTEWAAGEIVKQMNEKGYSLDDFEEEYVY